MSGWSILSCGTVTWKRSATHDVLIYIRISSNLCFYLREVGYTMIERIVKYCPDLRPSLLIRHNNKTKSYNMHDIYKSCARPSCLDIDRASRRMCWIVWARMVTWRWSATHDVLISIEIPNNLCFYLRKMCYTTTEFIVRYCPDLRSSPLIRRNSNTGSYKHAWNHQAMWETLSHRYRLCISKNVSNNKSRKVNHGLTYKHN